MPMQFKVSKRTEIELELFRIFGLGSIRVIDARLLMTDAGFATRHGFGGTALAATLYATGGKNSPDVRSELSGYGLYFSNGSVQFPLGIFKRHDDKFCVHIIAHEGAGQSFAGAVTRFARNVLASMPEVEVYIRYAGSGLFGNLAQMGWHDGRQKPWIQDVPYEDEQFCPRIADIGNLALSGNCRKNIRKVENKLAASKYELCPLTDPALAIGLIKQHFTSLKKPPVGSAADDYCSLVKIAAELRGERGVYAYMGYLDGQPVSVFIGQEYAPGRLALYANFTLRAEFHNLPLYAHMKLFEKLKEAGITHVNFGGSETKELDENKSHLAKLHGRQTYWANYSSNHSRG